MGLAVLASALVASASARAETVTFGFTGAEQTFPVPAGVTSIHVVAVGARGGSGTGNAAPGGNGARVTTDLAVSPGQIVFVEVGGNGEDGAGDSGGKGGFNGGGESFVEESIGSGGGGGGGASDVRLMSRSQAGSLASRLLVAAGGGGSGGSGGAGGAAGQDGATGTGSEGGGGGTAATTTAGGAGKPNVGTNGASGQGGKGGYQYSKSGGGAGGGGGGGLFGGGGGGGAMNISSGGGGGGGGSSSGGAVAPDTTGIPSITITYTSPAGNGPGANPGGGTAPAPDTTIDRHPAKVVETDKEKTTVRFRFSADQPGAGFLCKLDSAAFAPCVSPKRYRVPQGPHTFKVKATGDPTPATFSFRIKRKP